jgi:hypothetical protein
MKLAQFAGIEAVLYLLALNETNEDPEKAYFLFTYYHRIGATSCTIMDYVLQAARGTLGRYRSQKCWQDHLQEYRDPKYNAVRAFSFEEHEGRVSFSKREEPYPYPYEERQKEWEDFWTECLEEPDPPEYAGAGTYRYEYQNLQSGERETVHVKLDQAYAQPVQRTILKKGYRPPISIRLEELFAAAKEMAEICPGDPCYTILKSNILKQIVGTSVKLCTELTISQVVNIVGMVGAGKSTLIKVLAFWCHRNGYRMTIVVDTVAEVLNLQKYLSAFDVTASPLIGRTERLKYINQVAQPDEFSLPSCFSPYLTPACLIDGMDEQHKEAISFGKEPCYALRKGRKSYLCPFFDQCSGTKMLRDCYTASVVITTVAGFAVSQVGQQREIFLELVMREFDLVVFDECDRVQKTLDQLFLPETSIDQYIHDTAGESIAFRMLSSKRREEMPAEQRYDELRSKIVTVLSCILKPIQRKLGSWRKINEGAPFSALTLLENLYREDSEYQIPDFVYRAIYNLIDRKGKDRDHPSSLRTLLESSCESTMDDSFLQKYQAWRDELGSDFPQPQTAEVKEIQNARIQLILRLIYLDHFIQDLSDAQEACQEASSGKNELFGFLRTRFRLQRMFLPSAPCGNLFGAKMTEEKDIILFRQYAFGRSLMKDLPYLRIDSQGRPAGPHAILLSGSSWAEGSYEFHVNRPVNYILEADAEKRAFLGKTRFFESGFPERVSGAPEEQRMAQLRTVTQKAVELIIREYERKAGKILLVVNSYDQTKEVQQTLEAALRKAGCPASVCRMISDAASDQSDHGTIRRGEVGRFAKMGEDILIAPALAIERGHNIVDEYGHSALSAVFFMVRPMSNPDDVQQKGSKLNGYVEAHCKRAPEESIFAFNARFRRVAVQQWAKMSRSNSPGLAELDDEERKDVVATLFILILQIFGRLARVTDITKPAPHVFFMDGAFRGREDKPGDFDCLSELGRYLDEMMTKEESAEIAKTLYAPFYEAYRKDLPYEQYHLPTGV